MNYQQFANKTFRETQDQAETVDALLNEFIELDEEQAEQLAINAFEHAQGEAEYRAEQQFEIERGN